MTYAYLPGRAFIDVGGADAESFLQNLITTDLPGLGPGEAAPGALLSPQGKILFLFLISRHAGGFSLEVESDHRDNLLKRLTMYRLRAAVDLAPRETGGVTVVWDEAAMGTRDRRFATAGVSLTRTAGDSVPDSEPSDVTAYERLRIVHGIAEATVDYAGGDAFPHDVLLDRSGGLSFRKGCYVGQEVVSRMQHRGTARRRLVTVSALPAFAASGAAITAGGKTVGTLATVQGNLGLALVRVDRVGAALGSDVPLLVGDQTVTVALPSWSGLDFPAEAQGDDA